MRNGRICICRSIWHFSISARRPGGSSPCYPSPAGGNRIASDAGSLARFEEENPVLRDFEPDVEALLVNRVGPRREYYRVPIDECYKLVGLIRTHWRGLSGGAKSGKKSAILRRIEQTRSNPPEQDPLPDLHFHGDRAEAGAVRGQAAAGFQAARHPMRSCPSRSMRRCAPLPDSHRSGAGAVMTAPEQERLLDLFDEPSRWGQTLRPMLWTHASVVVPPFNGATLPSTCPCLHLRLQRGRDQVFLRPGGRRNSALPAFQRHDVLMKARTGLASRADSLGQGSNLSPAGALWKEMMEHVLSQHRLALPAQDVFDRLVLTSRFTDLEEHWKSFRCRDRGRRRFEKPWLPPVLEGEQVDP